MSSFYSSKILESKDKHWVKFAGIAYLVGVRDGFPLSTINSYVFENFHAGERVSLSLVEEDFLRYAENMD